MRQNSYKVKSGLSKEEVEIVQAVRKELTGGNLDIEKGGLSKKPWAHIFSLLEQSRAVKLSFYSNDAIINLSLYVTPKFPNLLQLVLACNKIQSIEALVMLNAPNLEDIMLMTNKITDIRSLRKAFFPHLKELNISNNPIKDPTPLTQLPSKIIQEIHIERWPNFPMIGQSKRWAVKLHPAPHKLKELTMKSYSRRAEPLIDAALAAKYACFKNT